VVETLRGILLLHTSEELASLVDVSAEALVDLRSLAPRVNPAQIVGMIRAFTPGPVTRGGLRPQLPLELSVVESADLLRFAPATNGASAAPPHRPPPSVSSEESLPRERAPAPRPAPDPQPTNGTANRTPAPPPTPHVAPAAAPVSEAAAPQAGILFTEAQRRWAEILEVCGARSRSIQALLRSGRPIGADGDTLLIGFPYPFHRERIEDVKNRIVVEETIVRVLGIKVQVQCVMSTRETLAAQDPLQAALDDPLVKAAVSLGARVRQVVEESSEEDS
jgi:hypothetical protein